MFQNSKSLSQAQSRLSEYYRTLGYAHISVEQNGNTLQVQEYPVWEIECQPLDLCRLIPDKASLLLKPVRTIDLENAISTIAESEEYKSSYRNLTITPWINRTNQMTVLKIQADSRNEINAFWTGQNYRNPGIYTEFGMAVKYNKIQTGFSAEAGVTDTTDLLGGSVFFSVQPLVLPVNIQTTGRFRKLSFDEFNRQIAQANLHVIAKVDSSLLGTLFSYSGASVQYRTVQPRSETAEENATLLWDFGLHMGENLAKRPEESVDGVGFILHLNNDNRDRSLVNLYMNSSLEIAESWRLRAIGFGRMAPGSFAEPVNSWALGYYRIFTGTFYSTTLALEKYSDNAGAGIFSEFRTLNGHSAGLAFFFKWLVFDLRLTAGHTFIPSASEWFVQMKSRGEF
ncbi:MAG: hypothetical protein KDK41_00820 [Leptospiraceae bacterium]|nr:hypothetical protein [Leptospiraceae bacterium]